MSAHHERAAIGVAFFLADGGLQTFTTVDYVYSAGRVLGIVAAASGAAVHVVLGARGDGWSSTEHPATLEGLVPDVAERDVYICGPGRWPATVEKEARAAGVARDSVHRETFAW